jgi:hypothetical protein
MGYSSNSPAILLGAFVWWMTIEITALLGMGLIAFLLAIKSAKINHHIDAGAIYSN